MSRIYVGRLSYQAREKDVERFFRGFGRIRDINLKNGFGFVEFEDPRDADDAVYELNGRELLSERVIVEHARGSSSGYGSRRNSGFGGGDRGGGAGRRGYGPPTRTDYRILVENISSRVSWQDLKDFMRSAGEITFADAHKQRVGEGVVEYATYEDMRAAMKKLDGADLNGRRLRLTEDYRGRKRSRSRSRSRSRDRRSRTRSRSRSREQSRDRSRSRGRYHSRSRSRSRSASPAARNRSRSHSRSRSKSRSKSKEAENSMDKSRDSPRSPRRSRSKSHDRSGSPDRQEPMEQQRSRSPSPAVKEEDTRSRSPSPDAATNGQD